MHQTRPGVSWRRAADQIMFPLDPRHVLVMTLQDPAEVEADPSVLRSGPNVEADAELIERVLNTVGLRVQRWIFMHPDDAGYESFPIPPPIEPLGGLKEVVDMARALREAHESSGQLEEAATSLALPTDPE